MHLYWRVIEGLKYLGERWDIIDPAILRRYQLWKQKHSDVMNILKERPVTEKDFKIFCKGSSSVN